jgi:prevent-host-death family protein
MARASPLLATVFPVRDDHLDSQDYVMKHVSVAEAKAKLSAILDGVIAGDEVIITRRGKKIARLGGMEIPTQVEAPQKKFDWEEFKARLEERRITKGSAVVEMRELDRY